MTDKTAPDLVRTSAFILAGGQGERLYPLTESRPKPAVSFCGMFRQSFDGACEYGSVCF
jgi:mannose-1-phosphate guanylyltransferase